LASSELAAIERELAKALEEQATRVRQFQRTVEEFPLAAHALWVKEDAKCDQRRAVVNAMRAPIVSICLGGWRSGKSEGYKQLTVAMAMGAAHPAVQAWLELNDLPTDVIPDGPAQVYAVAATSNDSLRYHRDDFDRLVGPYGTWYNKNGKGEALLTIAVPGTKHVGKIWFKAIDQGRRSFQGISIRYVWLDEEPLWDIGFGVYDECKARVADQSGKIGISMIPKEGLTWVWDDLVRDGKDMAHGHIVNLDALDNPYLPEDFRRLFLGMSEDDIAKNRYGQFRSLVGACYPMFNSSYEDAGHICEPFDIPADWPKFSAYDFGLDNPTCCLWGALDDDNCLYVFMEYYKANGLSWEWHAENVARMQGLEEIDGVWVPTEGAIELQGSVGDPSAKKAYETFPKYGLAFDYADNDRGGGVDKIKNRMRVRGDGKPRLKIFSNCKHLLKELPGLQWDPRRKDEMWIKENDHAPDTLRYLVALVDEWNGVEYW
jgi:phage terminase large subunit-like protein